MADQFQGMRTVIVEALRNARDEGLDYTGQSGAAVRAVMAIRKDLGAPEAMDLVKRVRATRKHFS
jgi:hypothetical protein